ncbi:twitching motility protein PilH [hydrothermal vent metagenome]|uniref:Twitching motility protein PilH n=1 Tax=hydrothermal vent metagenome TaxID=652676 RepID=A0A3B0YNF6_9ZZZZ
MAQILIIDDSPTEAHVLKGMLEKHGFDIETAENGAKGIERAREIKPDLILMDVVMPGLNGFQATRQLTRDSETKDIPVIIVTTKDQETDRVWGLRQGAKGFLTKPVTEENLMDKINAALETV